MVKNNLKRILVIVLCVMVLFTVTIKGDPTDVSYIDKKGGGYAASDQVENIGYMAVKYDATNGLPTSEANYIVSSKSGYMWIGSYGGIIKYSGSSFERLPNTDGLSSGRALFEDSKDRMWVGTNDSGVVIIDGDNKTHISKEEGLPSTSIRSFAEDNDGNIYIATTDGLAVVDGKMRVRVINDERIRHERILKLDSDSEGVIYGYTKNGAVFTVVGGELSEIYGYEELGIEKITSVMVDKINAGRVYIGTSSDVVYCGHIGDNVYRMAKISIAPLKNTKWMSYECGRVWVMSDQQLGYLDEKNNLVIVENLPLNDSLEMLTSDYQGNLWLASSRQGIMKIIANNFMSFGAEAGLAGQIVNATCFLNKRLYVGTDNGMVVLNSKGRKVDDPLMDYIDTGRVRHIVSDAKENLWISTFSNGIGLVRVSPDGSIRSYTVDDGLPVNEIRCSLVMSDGTVVCGTNNGLALIKDDKVYKTYGKDEGLLNTVILSLAEGENGVIYAGTDGGGLYCVEGDRVYKPEFAAGLKSDVIMRMYRNDRLGVFFIITSNSIAYLKDGKLTNVDTFPYGNNFDIYPDDEGNLWILSSMGVYCVDEKSFFANNITSYRLYSLANGLTSLPVANSYAALNDNGDMYIAGQNGVCKFNIKRFNDAGGGLITGLGSIYCDGAQILPDKDGVYNIPKDAKRLSITPLVIDYSMKDPLVRIYLEGSSIEGVTAYRSDLPVLEYTELPYGNYTLHVQVLDPNDKTVLSDNTWRIVKKPKLMEIMAIKILIIAALLVASGIIVWRILTGTVIRRQYDQIKEARDEAWRANQAKSRFLANMSHEIRTPINTIMGMDEMILREKADGASKSYHAAVCGYALNIKNASEALLSLVNDLLDISKIESGKMNLVEQEYDVVDLIRSVVTMIRVRSDAKKLYFDMDIDENIPQRLYGDSSKIKQVVLNLLTNAVKYTNDGGFVLGIRAYEVNDVSCTLKISVKDTGIGIKPEDQAKLFTAYERLDEEKNVGIQGAGLGLDISRQYAELMGGTLECKSTYGEGSEFILTVSQKVADSRKIGVFREYDNLSEADVYMPQFIAPDADILVVDDNPMNLAVIKGLLKPTKVFVTTADSGKDCLDKLKTGNYNVVLLDHMMPGMDGIETCARIREDYPDLPVYALTVNATAGDDEFYKSKGFNGYLAKPIDIVAVEHVIMRHLPEEIMHREVLKDFIAKKG